MPTPLFRNKPLTIEAVIAPIAQIVANLRALVEQEKAKIEVNTDVIAGLDMKIDLAKSDIATSVFEVQRAEGLATKYADFIE